MPGLKEADFEALLRQHAKDAEDEKDMRARVQMVVGDEEYWHGRNKKAAQAYWSALKLRPWWTRAWAKYLLLKTGGFGNYIRRVILDTRESRAEARS